MRIYRLLIIIFGLIAALPESAALAQTYPSKPVKLVVTYPPGGSSDLMARVLAQKLTEVWGQQVIVENRPGAAGLIGMQYAASQAPDGYSFVIGNLGPTAVNPILSKVPYDVGRDFIPVSLIATGPNILVVNPNTPVKTLGELIAFARANPGKLNFGSSGPGSVAQLSGEMFKNLAKVDIVHIGYKGGILSVQDLIAGHVQIVFSDALPVMQYIRAGRLRAIAVTSPERSPLVPDLPTCVESGLPGLVAVNWWGVLLPAGTPKQIVEKFHADLIKVMRDPGVKEKFALMGVDAVSSSPEQFAAYIKSETVKYAKLIKEAGIQAE
ncbi:MAG TPA: tripartite tricarboxylate transporter substrate binding protein [Acidiferrobacterales bacterium]|nr:tripartite tricarboxylate transporter substrate binding protein [Acidiferrobacterales bacterium]